MGRQVQGVENLRQVMGRGNKIDVMASPLLKPQHKASHPLNIYLVTSTQMADFKVLAKHAPKITVSQKDGARSTPPNQRRLLTEMGTYR